MLLEKGKAVTYYEPRGDFGLEGFGTREVINYEKHKDEAGKTYYKVQQPTWKDSWSKCNEKGFKRCFIILNDEQLKSFRITDCRGLQLLDYDDLDAITE